MGIKLHAKGIDYWVTVCYDYISEPKYTMKGKVMNTTFESTLEQFIDNDGFSDMVMRSTVAGFGGSGYSVELFEDGTWRVLWNNQIGNLYISPGVILPIGTYDDETVNDLCEFGEDADLSFALAEIAESMRRDLAYRLSEA